MDVLHYELYLRVCEVLEKIIVLNSFLDERPGVKVLVNFVYVDAGG